MTEMQIQFEAHYGYEVSEDMDIQTEVAWKNWQCAWKAAISAAWAEWMKPVSEAAGKRFADRLMALGDLDTYTHAEI